MATAAALDRRIDFVPLIKEWYDYLMFSDADPLTKDKLLMKCFFLHYFAMIFYVYTCAYLGPRFMHNRKPFKLKEVIMIYNAFQVVFNLWMLYMFVQGGWFNGFNFYCQPMDRSTPQSDIMALAFYWWFISKYVDQLDTYFFVLRKKYNQLSLLHIGHHGWMPMFTWYGARYMAGGHVTFIGFVNCIVHIIMYGYYFLSGLGPQFQKYLWWKKYLTMIQMTQFVILFIHQNQILFTSCNYYTYHLYWGFVVGPLIFTLFYLFYRETYTDRSSRQKNYLNGKPLNHNNNNYQLK